MCVFQKERVLQIKREREMVFGENTAVFMKNKSQHVFLIIHSTSLFRHTEKKKRRAAHLIDLEADTSCSMAHQCLSRKAFM